VVTGANLFHGAAAITSIGLDFLPDRSYQASASTTTPTLTHLDSFCLTAHGANPSCTDLATELTDFYNSMPNFNTIACCAPGTEGDSGAAPCSADPTNGCDCSYNYESTTADVGIWRVAGNIIYLASSVNQNQPILPVTFCANRETPSSATLQVTGFNGQSLLDIVGFRSMTMALVPPTPGM
jgi:hypothetical protein